MLYIKRIIMDFYNFGWLVFGLLWIISGSLYLYDQNPNSYKRETLLSPLQAGILFIIIGISIIIIKVLF